MADKGNDFWQIRIDTGGTFTDALGVDPDGKRHRTKVLSSSGLRGEILEAVSGDKLQITTDWEAPDHFINGFSFVLLGDKNYHAIVEDFDADQSVIKLSKAIARKPLRGASFEVQSPEGAPILAARLMTRTLPDQALPPMNLRLATTRGTNALLERKGASVTFFVTEGFGDLLKIGTQQRPDLFALQIKKPSPLYEQVIEVGERIDASGKILASPDSTLLKRQARAARKEGIAAAAVVGMNSYVNPEHEQQIGRVLREAGVGHVSVSSDLSRFGKLLPRAETALVNACLAPVLESYLNAVEKCIAKGRVFVMTSAGGLKSRSKFHPKDGLLSGPAAGVVGAAVEGEQAGFDKIISFDMGGTSTDVSRYNGDLDYVFEHEIGDAHLMAPAVAIETVAAGGGSICSYEKETLQVGPVSAGASPGPACYGAGGPLTLTDVNLLAGRLDEQNFHLPIDKQAARKALRAVINKMNADANELFNEGTVLEGFLEIANQRMAEAIKKISLRKGYDPREYALVAFGGAGGQHCCAIAGRLGIDRVIIPGDAGLLSTHGLGRAVMEHFEEEQILETLDEIEMQISDLLEKLERKGRQALSEENPSKELTVRRRLLFMRLKGQQSTLEISWKPELNLADAFREKYRQRYGHWVEDAAIEIESLRVVLSTKAEITARDEMPDAGPDRRPAVRHKDMLFNGKEVSTAVYDRTQVAPGAQIKGPALVLDPYSTIVVEPGWKAKMGSDDSLILHPTGETQEKSQQDRPEAVRLELFTHRFTSIAEKMGEILQRTARSVNVKERQDFSCALLDPGGRLIVNAPHIPVHLGAMGVCLRRLMEELEMRPGDVVVTNHPAWGGSHLPDVTVVTPVFSSNEVLLGFAANRAHHAEIGGTWPGSMPSDATRLVQEGVVIPPMYLMRTHESRWDEIREHLLTAEYPTRSIGENMADLQAQVAANRQGARALRDLAEQQGTGTVHHYMKEGVNRAERLMRETIRDIPNGAYRGEEQLDDGTPLCARWEISEESLSIDFAGTGAVHPRNLNATPAIVNSVVMYVLRVLIDQSVPLNEGLMQPVSLNLPEGLLNPTFSDDPAQCPAVVGGNVEVSQRLTDTLLKPFERIACGQGTMNNVLFGNDSFGYYETVGGGSGAGPHFDGADGVHQHMTNTQGTDPEIFERRYPVRLDRYAIREGSGGAGKHPGGDGIIREMTFLEPMQLSVLTQHRLQAPYGRQGGMPGEKGEQWIIRKNGDKEMLEPSDGRDLQAGDRFILHTPGGGGFGSTEDIEFE